jgi:hypothetical protein
VFKSNIAGYPSGDVTKATDDSDHLPDGAAVLSWNSTSKFSYTTAKLSTSAMTVTDLTSYVYPACLYYWGKSGILTSEVSKKDLYVNTNKWSDIAKFLPGRTDNAIKNHFYSKLRKYIRKILKQINKENLIKNNGIDSNKYNSDKIYKMLKKYKVPYKSLNKDTVLDLIISTEKNSKITKNSFNLDIHLPKTKIKKIKSTTKEKESLNNNHQVNTKVSKNKDNLIPKQKNRSVSNQKKNLTINVRMINKIKSQKNPSKISSNLYPNYINKPPRKKKKIKKKKSFNLYLKTKKKKKKNK